MKFCKNIYFCFALVAAGDMAEVEGQFAGVEVILQQVDTRAFADGRELGTGILSVEER